MKKQHFISVLVGMNSIMGLLLLIALMCIGQLAEAQNKEKKIKPKLRLNYTKHIDSTRLVKANVYYMDEGDKIFCEGLEVGFYKDEEGNELFKKVSVNEEGIAALELNEQEIKAFEQYPGHYYFYAASEANDRFKQRDEDLYITESTINVDFNDKDSLKILEATVIASNDSTAAMTPMESVPLKFFVDRALAPLVVGGDFNFTDEEGSVDIEFPQDIPGNEEGNLTVLVKIEEHDEYGTVIYKRTIDWGIMQKKDNPIAERSIIGDNENAPIFMVVSINAILVIIWGYLIYLAYGLVRIKKIGTIEN